jgi:hypothetical protein
MAKDKIEMPPAETPEQREKTLEADRQRAHESLERVAFTIAELAGKLNEEPTSEGRLALYDEIAKLKGQRASAEAVCERFEQRDRQARERKEAAAAFRDLMAKDAELLAEAERGRAIIRTAIAYIRGVIEQLPWRSQGEHPLGVRLRYGRQDIRHHAAVAELEQPALEPYGEFKEAGDLKKLTNDLNALAVQAPPSPMEQSPHMLKVQRENEKRMEADRECVLAEAYARQTGRRVA